MLSTKDAIKMYKCSRQWLYDNRKKLKPKKKIIDGKAMNFYSEVALGKLRNK